MRFISALLGMAVSAGAASAGAQQVPFGDLLAMANEQMSIECERALEPDSARSALVQREAEMNAAVFCDCMPPALTELASERAPTALISSDEFSALLLREFDVCSARAVREASRQGCAGFTPPGAPPGYCECFAAAVDELTDEEIVADSIAVRDNLTRRAEARRRGTAEPPLLEGLLARIDTRCRAP